MTLADDSDKIIAQVNNSKRIVVVSHMNPDPDAYGSTLALVHILKNAGKQVVAVNVSGTSDRYPSIPGLELITSTIPEGEWDLLIAVDAATAGRLGDNFSSQILAVAPISVNIDHHISNQLYGTLNFVDETASSTCEILAELVERAKWQLVPEAAAALLAGIYGDTGAFRYSITTKKTFAVAQKLIEAGAVPHKIASDLYGKKRLSAVRLQAHALLNFELLVQGRLAIVFIDQSVFDQCNASHEDAEGLAEEMRDIEGVEVSALVYWFGDCWKASMRSVADTLNVSAVAQEFGGGGHVQAAAFRSRLEKQALYSALIRRLTELLS